MKWTKETPPAGQPEFRAAGFSPSGLTIAVATSSDLALWTRGTDDRHAGGRDMTEFGWKSGRRRS
ncbi:hypothetical protein [Streptomyces sp. NPDC050548]|uniref:hypothetical protein n=1 Tax=Streptomyces sp. NPDC050548 TaxID=3365629 RepID=UPI0037AC8E15